MTRTAAARAVGATALVITAGVTAGCAAGHSTLDEQNPAPACAAPFVTVEPAATRPGEQVTVHGSAMIDGCADAIGVDEHGNQTPNETESPITSIDVVLNTGDMKRVLATVDADEQGEFEVTVVVPEATPTGSAQISTDVDFTEPAELQVVAGS